MNLAGRGRRGQLLSIKVASPYSQPAGTFLFNPWHEQFSKHILVLKGHRQGEMDPLWLPEQSCCQAAPAAAWSLEQLHPSPPQGITYPQLPGCWQGPQQLPVPHGGCVLSPYPPYRRASSHAGDVQMLQRGPQHAFSVPAVDNSNAEVTATG